MDAQAERAAESEVLAFVESLYDSPTIHHAVNHSQMEAWVALEGLAFFKSRGWATWETLGFAYGPGTPGSELKIKFPDLVCVRDHLSLWWEFKAISRLSLHPKNAGGTFVKDVAALATYHKEYTRTYLENGTLPPGRGRNDSRTITASGLKKILGANENIGIAMLFSPREKDLYVPGHPEPWSPQDRVGEIASTIAEIKGVSHPVQNISAQITDRLAKRTSNTACHAWLVPMGK